MKKVGYGSSNISQSIPDAQVDSRLPFLIGQKRRLFAGMLANIEARIVAVVGADDQDIFE